MTNTVLVKGDKTFGEGDDGTVQCVEVKAAIKLPHEDTWKFMKEDEFEIVSNTDSTVTVVGEKGVTLTSNLSMSAKGNSIKIKYQGDNTYLIWGTICLIIFIGLGVFTYSDTMQIIEDGVTLIKHSSK